MKKYTSKTIALSLILCLSTTQISLTCFEDWRMYKEEIPEQVSVNSYLAQLEHDLKPSPRNDVNDIINESREELKKLRKSELKNKDRVNQILRTVIINHVEDQACIMGYQHSDDSKAINKTTESMVNNIRAVLGKKPYIIDGKKICKLLGKKLDKRVRDNLNDRPKDS